MSARTILLATTVVHEQFLFSLNNITFCSFNIAVLYYILYVHHPDTDKFIVI